MKAVLNYTRKILYSIQKASFLYLNGLALRLQSPFLYLEGFIIYLKGLAL
jgi:hypothetical protein